MTTKRGPERLTEVQLQVLRACRAFVKNPANEKLAQQLCDRLTAYQISALMVTPRRSGAEYRVLSDYPVLSLNPTSPKA